MAMHFKVLVGFAILAYIYITENIQQWFFNSAK